MSAWGDKIRAEYDLPPELEEILIAAEQAHARWTKIREQLDAEELMVPGRYENAPRINPLLGAEARARESFVRCVRALKLPEENR